MTIFYLFLDLFNYSFRTDIQLTSHFVASLSNNYQLSAGSTVVMKISTDVPGLIHHLHCSSEWINIAWNSTLVWFPCRMDSYRAETRRQTLVVPTELCRSPWYVPQWSIILQTIRFIDNRFNWSEITDSLDLPATPSNQFLIFAGSTSIIRVSGDIRWNILVTWRSRSISHEFSHCSSHFPAGCILMDTGVGIGWRTLVVFYNIQKKC